MVKIEIIYSDDDIAVVNKPPGIAVHGQLITGSGIKTRRKRVLEFKPVPEKTLVDFLVERFPELKLVGDDPVHRPGIVHRLDKDTSGVMVVARNQESFKVLKNLFKSRLVEKIYWAVVCGIMSRKQGEVSLPMGRLARNPLKRGVVEGRSKIKGAREAMTEYRVLKTAQGYSLVELRPKTGRMHQLRVHLKALGHPVACDRLYGGKNVCCPEGVNRQLLHARSLSFSFPEGRRLYFETEPPDDFALALEKIF